MSVESGQEKYKTFDLKPLLADSRMRGFFNLLRGYRWRYLVAVLALGGAALFNALAFLVIRYVIDDIISAPGTTESNIVGPLILAAVGFVVLYSLRAYLSFVSGRLAVETSEGIAMRLRDYMFDHIQRLSFTYHDNMQTGDLISRVTSDIDAIRRFFAEQAVGATRITTLFLFNLIAVLTMHWQLGLLTVASTPIVVIVTLFFFRRVEKAWSNMQEQEAMLSTRLQENLTGVRVVKAFARQDYEIDQFEKENWEKYERGKRFTTMHAFFWPTLDVVTGIQLIVGYYIAGRLVLAGDITVGTFLAYASLAIWIIFPIRNLGRIVVQMSTGLVSFGRVKEIIAEEREFLQSKQAVPKTEVEGKVTFTNVGFAYEKDVPVLQDISFTVEPGQTVALLGSTGSGKTSLVGLLPRFYEYTSGLITLDDIDLKEYPKRFLRDQIGIVQQEPFLFSRTLRENIMFSVGREVSEEEVVAAAEAAAIHEVIESFPDGYDTQVGERGVTLSGGQKQRVALARTLLKNPKILILDDATSAVDTETEAHIRDALRRMMKQRTSFIIAHRIQSVMNADLILVMDHGEIVERGSHSELMEADGIYKRVYDMQARIEDELERELSA